MIRIVVADDHDLVRTGITRMLEDVKDIQVIAQAVSGEEAVTLARQLDPDVILMDVKMPGIGGLEATRKIQRYNPDIKVIVVTACADEPFPSRLLQAGAVGYITKGAALEDMVNGIRLAVAGKRYISPDIAQQLALKPFQETEESLLFDQLSEREMQIAMMIVSCQKVQAISDKLCLSPKTVNSYRYRIFDKLNINSDVELALLAVRYGLLDGETIGH